MEKADPAVIKSYEQPGATTPPFVGRLPARATLAARLESLTKALAAQKEPIRKAIGKAIDGSPTMTEEAQASVAALQTWLVFIDWHAGAAQEAAFTPTADYDTIQERRLRHADMLGLAGAMIGDQTLQDLVAPVRDGSEFGTESYAIIPNPGFKRDDKLRTDFFGTLRRFRTEISQIEGAWIEVVGSGPDAKQLVHAGNLAATGSDLADFYELQWLLTLAGRLEDLSKAEGKAFEKMRGKSPDAAATLKFYNAQAKRYNTTRKRVLGAALRPERWAGREWPDRDRQGRDAGRPIDHRKAPKTVRIQEGTWKKQGRAAIYPSRNPREVFAWAVPSLAPVVAEIRQVEAVKTLEAQLLADNWTIPPRRPPISPSFARRRHRGRIYPLRSAPIFASRSKRPNNAATPPTAT